MANIHLKLVIIKPRLLGLNMKNINNCKIKL